MSSERADAPLRVRVERMPTRASIPGCSKQQWLERLVREREAAAHALGREQGRVDAEESAAGALVLALEKLETERSAAAARMATDAVELAIEIARVLVRREIDSGHHDIEKIVRETLAVSGVGRGSCVVHLNPADAERVKRVPFRAGTQIESDHEVVRGDVHVTTPYGVLVRDVDDALESIADRIRQELS